MASEPPEHRFAGVQQHPLVAVDVAVFTLTGGALHCLLVRVREGSFAGKWAFPGGLVRAEESLDEAAERELFELTGVRGGYMGMLMFGMFGTLVGFSLLNPITVGAGLLMGRKTIGDERRRIVAKRQNDAKVVLRRYVDDVTFHVGKESRDMLRGVQRVLRDHFTAQADQLKVSLQESLLAAKNSVKATQAERDTRLAEIRAALERLDVVRKNAVALLPGGAR